MPIAIRDSAVLVTGFGRIGKSLSAKLHALGAHVTITTRDQKNFPAPGLPGRTAPKTAAQLIFRAMCDSPYLSQPEVL